MLNKSIIILAGGLDESQQLPFWRVNNSIQMLFSSLKMHRPILRQ